MIIKFENVTKTYKTDFWVKPFKSLDNISFSIEEGKIIGFLGANGAGKTTSIKLMMGFSTIDSGSIIFSTKLGKNKNEIFSTIGYVPERPYFYPHLSGNEFIIYMGRLFGLKKAEILTNLKKWSMRLKIDYALDRKISTYSKGMLQRLGFLTALIHDPMLIILDEPVSGMDPIGRKEIKDVIVELNKLGKTIFFSTHIIPDVEEVCDSVIFIDKGKLVYQGTVENIIYQNMNTSFSIKYRDHKNLSISELVCDKNEKDNAIKKILESSDEIISLNARRPSLEEIFYNVKQQDKELS